MTESIQIIPDPVTGDMMVDVLAHMHMTVPDTMDQKILDHGFVRILDVMPRLVPVHQINCDFALADAARLSYQKGTRKISSDSGLVDNLVRNRHTSPIEMGELKFHLRMPIFVMRQHVRHRMASLNEESARYSELASDFYIPDAAHWARNTAADKQATVQHDGGGTSWDFASFLYEKLKDHNEASYKLYRLLLGDDLELTAADEDEAWRRLGVPAIAREQARMVLGVNIYTQCIWKIDLKNLLHYLSLRCEPHAQFEIRCLADPIRAITKVLFPSAWDSFEDHFVDGVNFGRRELTVVRSMTMGMQDLPQLHETLRIITGLSWTMRRLEEFTKKLAKSGLVSAERIPVLLTEYKALLARS